ncbi:unnamed protein product [Arabidopsis arenosa]|uniref:Methyltransferase family protein n=1 Tax=Arabidopsis arenosa TaxID=38785 RepID=A0A8S1ZKZ1_ARAAE|nr:unnamed protein product [Arabidopsis arenosa]
MVFEFSRKLHGFEIIECGAKILTEEESMEGSYEPSEEVIVDETNIDDLSSKEVEKRTDCWSWLFLCFGLSVSGKETIESEGVLYANLPQHPLIESVPNLAVDRLVFREGEEVGDRDGYQGGPRSGGDVVTRVELLLITSLLSGYSQRSLVLVLCFVSSRKELLNGIKNLKEEYGLFVWPCSVILAEYVWQQRSRFRHSSVLELGAGTSLPGLVAAKVGANVTLTDDASKPEVLDNMRRVCELNKLNCNVMGFTWGVWDAPIFDLRPNIILGADVLYDSSAFDDLFATVSFLLQSSPDAVFITTYHNRSGHHLIEFLMVKWGLKCVKLLDGFSFLPSHKASVLSGNIQLVEIVLSSNNQQL